jgi:hypothetical protein
MRVWSAAVLSRSSGPFGLDLLVADTHQAQCAHAYCAGSRGGRLLASIKEERFLTFFTLMYHCGLRLGEACRLEVTHLDSKRGLLRVINGKGGKNREVPVAPEMFTQLRQWWVTHRNPRFLFPGVGRAWKEKYGCNLAAMKLAQHPMSEASVQQAMKAAILTSRLTKTGINCHALRHSYATHMLEENVSVRQLQSYLGHSDIKTTMMPMHIRPGFMTPCSEQLQRRSWTSRKMKNISAARPALPQCCTLGRGRWRIIRICTSSCPDSP